MWGGFVIIIFSTFFCLIFCIASFLEKKIENNEGSLLLSKKGKKKQ
jgi:hypothetical protein